MHTPRDADLIDQRRNELAEQIKQRRAQLGLSVVQAAKAAGLSRDAWYAAERAKRGTDARSRALIERVLRWQPGSINAILAGGAPTAEPDYSQNLADLITKRRMELGLSDTQAARTVGVAKGVWVGIERGTREPEERIYSQIERMLRWAPGSVRAVLAGGEPTVGAGPQESPYLDPDTGEVYTDADERDLWALSSLPAAERRKLIYYLRSERQRAATEQAVTRQQRRRRAG